MTANSAAEEKMDEFVKSLMPTTSTDEVKDNTKVRYMTAPVSREMMKDFKRLRNNTMKLKDLIRSRRLEVPPPGTNPDDENAPTSMSQADLARALNIASPEFIGLVENGRRRFALNNIPALADVLRINREDLCKLALFEEAPQFAMSLFGNEPSAYNVGMRDPNAPPAGPKKSRTLDQRQIDYHDKLWSLPSPLRNTVLNIVDQFTALQSNRSVRAKLSER